MELFIKANWVSRYNLRMLYENIRIPIAIFVAMIYVWNHLPILHLLAVLLM